jgi:tRNA (cmo5U34)-methyltransferase
LVRSDTIEEGPVTDTAKTDQVLPDEGARWQFDGSVTEVFDNMLVRSIPQYDVMRQAVFDLGASFVTPDTAVVDLGCSRGEALAPFVERFTANRFVGVEVSEPMLDAVRARFARQIAAGTVDIRKLDLRTDYPRDRASLTLAVLTIQFTPIEYRQRIVRTIFEHTVPGGAFIFVEKILGSTALVDELFVARYYDMKARNGSTTEQIERKRLALEGVLVPVTARWNEDLLRDAGFRQVECFWRWFNFAGWIGIKD